MKAFKHVPLQFADAFEAGTQIMVGTFEAYRGMEGSRGDPLEGLAVNRVPPGVPRSFKGSPSEEERAAFAAMGFSFGPAASAEHFEVENWTHTIPLAPMYLFCMSSEPDWARVSREGEAVFEIEDLDLFAHRLRAGRPNLLGHHRAAPVTYIPRATDPFIEAPAKPDPFAKNPDLAHEREIRIVWQPRQPGKAYEIISAPKAARLVRRLAQS